MSPTVYLVSGANRGIGLEIVTQLVARDNVIIFAGARNPSTATDLQILVQTYQGRFHVVKLVSSDKAGNEAAVAEVKKIAGRLDVVIANAGISQYFGTILETPLDQMREHYEVNVVGTLALFQAAYPLLRENPSTPKFIPISSFAGSITDGVNIPLGMTAYGVSKAAENYLARKIHAEYPSLICFPLHPGTVLTDMAENAFKLVESFRERRTSLLTVEESASKITTEVDKGTRDTASGQFVSYTGERLNW